MRRRFNVRGLIGFLLPFMEYKRRITEDMFEGLMISVVFVGGDEYACIVPVTIDKSHHFKGLGYFC